MAESKAHLIAQALLQLAESIAPGVRGGASTEAPAQPTSNVDDAASLADVIARAILQGKSNPPAGGGRPAQTEGPPPRARRDPDEIAALIRALCPATAPTTSAENVASLIRALCPATSPATNLPDVVALIQALSPVSGTAGRSGMEALIRALSPAQPGVQNSAVANLFGRSDLRRILESLSPAEEQLRSTVQSLSETQGQDPTLSATAFNLAPRQLQGIAVLRALSPVATMPRTSITDAVQLLHALCPAGDRPSVEVANVIAALSPAADRTVSSPDDAVNFIRGLCPAGPVPATDVGELVRALSPANDAAATDTNNVAALVRALCPAGSEPTEVAALIRALSPADEPTSNVNNIADLIRVLSPADITPYDVLRTLSPAFNE